MLIGHFVLALANVTVWGIILIRLFHNFIKTKTDSDLRLFTAYLFMGGFLVGETIIIACQLPATASIPYVILAQKRMLALLNLESIFGMFIAIAIIMNLMRQVAKEVGMRKRFNAIRTLVICVLIGLILVSNAVFVSTLYIDNFPVQIEAFPWINIPLIAIITILISIATPSKFLTVLKNIRVDLAPYQNKQDFKYALLMNTCLYTFLAGVLAQMYLAMTSSIVIFGDMLILVALVFGFWSTFMHGFGETISTILNLRALYFIHFSGLPIYSHIFSRLFAMDKYYFSSLFLTITHMVENVVRDKKKLQRLVMQNGTELIVESGELCIGIMITKKFHPFFKKKLQEMVHVLEIEENEALTKWKGESEYFNKKMDDIISRVL